MEIPAHKLATELRQSQRFIKVITLACALCPLSFLAGCSPQVLITHSPVQPTNAQNVTYTAQASGPGITSVEIWESRYALNGDVCDYRDFIGGCAVLQSSTLLHTCSYMFPTSSPTCSFVTTSPYPDESIIGYKSVVHAVDGSNGTDGWVYYAAGAFQWLGLLPIRVSADSSQAIDVVFIPDTDFNGNNGEFITAVTNLLNQGYLSAQPFAQHVRPWRGLWNFYVIYQTAHGATLPCNGVPTNWTALRAIVDNGAIVHKTLLRDCSWVGPENGAMMSVTAGDVLTLLHESGHGVFGLADEYCCDGGYFQSNGFSPQPNVFSSLNACQTNATSNGWPTTDCTQIVQTPIPWWRSDDGYDLMATSATNFDYGRSDEKDVYWLYFQRCIRNVGC